MQHSIFAGLDVWVIGYAAFMATLVSVLTTLRSRNAQRARGLPLSPWWTLIPDTGLGSIAGTFLAIGVPTHVPLLNNFSGVGFLAGAGGAAGPYLWDLLSSKKGAEMILDAFAAYAAGPLAKFLAARQKKDGDSNGNDQAPPTAPQ